MGNSDKPTVEFLLSLGFTKQRFENNSFSDYTCERYSLGVYDIMVYKDWYGEQIFEFWGYKIKTVGHLIKIFNSIKYSEMLIRKAIREGFYD